MRRYAAIVAVFAGILAGGCRGGDSTPPSSPTSPSPPAPAPAPTDLTVQGDPESSSGATWTYRGTMGGVSFDLQGILMKPQGRGPFPAVIISHGAGNNTFAYSRDVAMEMAQWRLVCIGTNYTHAGGVPLGAPGTAGEAGASAANVLRAHAVYEILRLLGYVDMARVAAHGHSAGAFVTSALVATYPNDFRAASHTAGGVRPDMTTGDGVAPSEVQVRSIRTPYQIHHGDADALVPLGSDQRFANILQSSGVPSELYVYPGAQHNDVRNSPTVLARIRAWYATYGLF